MQVHAMALLQKSKRSPGSVLPSNCSKAWSLLIFCCICRASWLMSFQRYSCFCFLSPNRSAGITDILPIWLLCVSWGLELRSSYLPTKQFYLISYLPSSMSSILPLFLPWSSKDQELQTHNPLCRPLKAKSGTGNSQISLTPKCHREKERGIQEACLFHYL